VAKLVNANDNFDGLSSSQICQRVHTAGLKCVPLMYAGAGNFGTDQGIQNILNDSPAGTRNAFITAMVGEAEVKGYDGYNLDWEVNNTGYAAYGTKLVSFLTAFKDALHQHGMTVSLDLGTWYVRQCTGSGGDGLVDLAQLGHSLDLAIIEDYAGSLGTSPMSCPATNPAQVNCDKDFVTQLGAMCNLPPDVVSIGLISPGTNPFAPDALAAVSRFGYTRVAVWPDDAQFLNAARMPQGATWYSVLAAFLGK
jgi:spore germination protein YaaH